MNRDRVVDAAALLARVTALGRGLAIDVRPLVEALARSGLALDPFRVAIDRTGAVVRATGTAREGLAGLDVDVEPAAYERGAALAARAPATARLAVELGSDGGVAYTAYARWDRDEALATVAGLAGLADRAPLAARVALLDGAGARGAAIATRLRPPADHTVELQLAVPVGDAAATRALAALADASGASRPQRGLVESLGPIFAARSRPSMLATVHAGGGAVLPRVGLAWRAIPFDLVLRVLVGLGDDGDAAGRRVGALAGAFDTDVATAFELVLGAGEPAATIAVDLVGGKAA